ncbi:HBS1-like protein [Thoreauomyces humboldtii]|nr:HBS1-like protein [Thoreauomyces humboldtii]
MSGADAIKTALAALGSPAAPKVSWSGTFNGLVAPNNQVGALQREPRSVTSFAVPMVPVSNPLAPQSTSATKTSILPRGPTHSIFTSVPGTNNATLAPLTAAPSTFAEFFTTEALPALTDLRTDLVVSVSSSVPLATGENVQPFRFDSPSPDDVVAKARLQSTQAKSHSSKTILTKPPSVKTVPPPNQKPTVEESDPRDQLQSDMSSLGFASESRPRLRPPPDISRSASTPAKGSSLQVPSMAKTSSTNSVKSSPKMKRINITDEYKRRNADKETLNLVVVGHVDAGKSTLMGHLLYLLGEVSDRSMKKFERDAEKMKKGSFAYAWVLDETEEERSRGVTIDVAITKFQTEHRKFTLLDAPGHRDFVPNMMSGASQADVAILVVDATPGEFETGFDFGGQTREHAVLIRSLGVQQLIVAINKLDVVDWNKARFDAISAKLTTFLTQVGFRKQKLWFVPTSGFTGENLLKRTAAGLNAWYSGPTLVSQIDAFDPPERPIDKPFRLSISDYFKGGIAAGGGGGAVSVSGRIEGGSVQIGESVLVLPINEVGMVKALEVAEESVKWAAAGDNVLLSLSGVDITHINIGSILCDPSSPVPITTHFLAQIVTFDIEIPLTIGVPVVLHHQSLTEQATITRLRALLNRTTNEVIKKNPRALPRNVTALVEIKTTRPVCLDLFRNSKELGRFLLRSGMVTVAGGVVMEILAYEKAGSGSEDVI